MNRIFLALRAKVGWLQPFPNPDIDAANHPTITSQSQPRRNRFQITFQPPEAARRTIPRLANTHDSTILRVEYKNDSDATIPHPRFFKSATLSCMALARPSTASAVASLPTPHATRRGLRSCGQCCHERRRRRETQTLVKWAFRGDNPQIFALTKDCKRRIERVAPL